MNKQGPFSGNSLQDKWLSRRNLIRGAAGAALGAGLIRSKPAHADDDEDRHGAACNQVNPIPGGLAPFKPFGVFIHHNPLNAATPLGVLRGLQTFLQLVEVNPDGFAVPAVTIRDQPRFPWRGLHLDVARHWMPLPVVWP